MAGQTDTGRHRQDNQDTFVSRPLWSSDDALLVVIDGVGGYAGGAEAAALAREAIVQYMATPTGDTLTMLREAVVHANNEIVRRRQLDPALARMCCVLTAAVVDSQTQRLLFAHVGDTRLYRFRQQRLEKLTHDHSLVGVREDANQLTEREAMHHPRRNEIFRDVGSTLHRVDDPNFLESDETDFLPGDVLLLCSDGLTDMLTRAQLTDVLTQPISVEKQVEELIRQANEQGGLDNITVVLAHFSAPLVTDVQAAPVAPVSVEESSIAPMPLAQTAPVAPPAVHWVRRVGLFSLLVLLAGALWWAYEASVPSPTRLPQPVPADSTVKASPINKPDSIRKP